MTTDFCRPSPRVFGREDWLLRYLTDALPPGHPPAPPTATPVLPTPLREPPSSKRALDASPPLPVSQYRDGVHKISSWSDIVNAHLVPGPGIIDGLRTVGGPAGKGLLLLAEMSSKGTLARGDYTEEVAKAAADNADFVMGFISTNPAKWKTKTAPGMIHMTPGVQLAEGGDALGQQYNTPDKVSRMPVPL